MNYLKIIQTGIVACTLSVIMAGTAVGHSWYPDECCNDKDCAEATVTKRNKNGFWLRHGKFKTDHFVRYDYDRFRPSPDGKYHICTIDEPTSEAHGSVMCVFVPAGV